MAGTSYALVEVSGVVAAVDSLDAMCKAAAVSFVTWERKLGGRLVTIIVEGNVADCKAAEEACINICKENGHKLAAHGVIAAPSDGIREIVKLSASKPKHGQGVRRPDVMDLMMPETKPEPAKEALVEETVVEDPAEETPVEEAKVEEAIAEDAVEEIESEASVEMSELSARPGIELEEIPSERMAGEPRVSSSHKKQLTSNGKNGKQGLGKTDLRK